MKVENTYMNPRMIGRPSETGVALLTVLALLSVFAVVLVGFTYTLRMEEITVNTYAENINVQEAAETAIQGVLGQVARDLDPANPHIVLGRPQRRYASLLDPWAVGYAGQVGKRVTYDARSHQVDTRPELRRLAMRQIPTPIPLRVDEDPPGDKTGMRVIGAAGRGDGFPGLGGIDDDLDGIVDNKFGEADKIQMPHDDDEDQLVDEDGYDMRRPDRNGTFPFTPGTGYDADGDLLGVFDENAKININFAGNNWGQQNGQTYNLGVSTSELDLPLFLFNRVVNYLTSNNSLGTLNQRDAEELAQRIVSFRYGSFENGGTNATMQPGEENQDDNNNNNPEIVRVDKYSDAFNTTRFEGEPYAIYGNEKDDDGDSLYNEEDERYIGPTTENQSGTPLTGALGQVSNAENFRPGDRIDNDGDGYIDERNEGIDDPSEFNVFKPNGNDRPFATVEDLRLINGIPDDDPVRKPGGPQLPSMFQILRDSCTIYSQSDEISGPLSGKFNEVAKINPNAAYNWRAADIWKRSNNDERNRADFQYSPPLRLEDLFPLQVDNDGDWQLMAEPDVEKGEADGIDNDGDGLIDEPSDDYDGNLYPSGDFDGYGEPDIGSPAVANGQDDDGDGFTDDDIRTAQRDEVSGRHRVLGKNNRLRDEDEREILPGMVVEGNGKDDDGDNLVDDDGDFNGDKLLTHDPEWHVNEDGYGDLSADGFPGLGALPDADEDSDAGDILKEPEIKRDLLITNFADDDWDGFADFNDPQVIAAMYAPELDGVDNDNDGEVDETGERYIACFDDDEDGRMDEDPAEFQIALNLYDYIDTWAPFQVAEDPDIRTLLGKSEDDPVLADPVTFRSLNLYTTRQRAFRMHSRLLAGPNRNSREEQVFTEYMRFLLPSPPQTGMRVTYEGVESVRINEVMAKPVIRLEAEDVFKGETIEYDTSGSGTPPVLPSQLTRFQVISGGGDDGMRQSLLGVYDSNWGSAAQQPAQGSVVPAKPGFTFLPEGFKNTFNPYLPLMNMDSMAPAFIFGVTNTVPPPDTDVTTMVGRQLVEEAEWTFENLPAGLYDVVLYLHPGHQYHPEVQYFFNGEPITFRSDFAFGDASGFTGAASTPPAQDQIRRDTAWLNNAEFKLRYRLTPFPLPDQWRVNSDAQRVEVKSDGTLTVRIRANAPQAGSFYETSFDRIELINPRVQYLELVNISTQDLDISGWTIDTPFGHYIIPENTVISRMKPSWDKDDGRELRQNEGLPGDGVPFENMFERSRIGQNISGENLLLEDNKLLIAFDKAALIKFLRDNYPAIPNLDERVVQPNLAEREKTAIMASIQNGPAATTVRNAQLSDLRFRLVDVQEDILTHNPTEKMVTLYDPAGNYIDSFRYRTTFNNAIVNIRENGPGEDLIALPGYRGFETFERTDPTWFENDLVVNPNAAANNRVSIKRTVPTMKLDAKQAIVTDMTVGADGELARVAVGGYDAGNDPNNNRLTRFKDAETFPARDSHWNGWDFIGDHYEYLSKSEKPRHELMENTGAIAREAVAPDDSQITRFYQMLGGFENATDIMPAGNSRIRSRGQENVTAFIWRLGARELIRAGFDPDVSDLLTVRVLGRKYVDRTGIMREIDMPVGEVMVTPVVRVVDPGQNPIHDDPDDEENPYNIFAETAGRGGGSKKPVFAKLRNGDTAFTIDLREDFTNLWRDLLNPSGDEPMLEIAVVLRKTTRDYNPFTRSQYGRQLGWIYPQDRPDLGLNVPVGPDQEGYYNAPGVGFLGGMGDDNYFFRGIEIFGRGRLEKGDSEEDNALLTYLAGTPGRDNTGYVPAYPRRRTKVNTNQRDTADIIDNTAYVKNGPLATLGEISRLFTGNKFETVNSPIIPQRLEDKSVDSTRILPTYRLAERARSSNRDYQIQLAQRERLDQWENQYTQLYNMITTAEHGIMPGLININTAPREVLVALPFAPLKDIGQLDTLLNRHYFNTIVADFIIEGRMPVGRDMAFGVHSLDDDIFQAEYNNNNTPADTLSDYKFPSVGRTKESYKSFESLERFLDDRNIFKAEDTKGDQASNFNDFYLSTEVTDPDDGPYSDIGTLLAQMTHLKRRERFAEFVYRQPTDRTGDTKPDGVGDLRERLNAELSQLEDLTPEDMEAMMNRISSLITVRSRSFGIITRGRIFDTNGNVTAQRRLETVYQR